MEKISVTIDWTGDNFSATTADVNGAVIVTHKNFDKLLKEFEDAFDFHIESSVEDGDELPQWVVNGDYEFEYHYTTAALLHKYDGIISRAGIARISGIHEKQIGHYASGHRKPRPATRQKIINAMHKLGEDFISVV